MSGWHWPLAPLHRRADYALQATAARLAPLVRELQVCEARCAALAGAAQAAGGPTPAARGRPIDPAAHQRRLHYLFALGQHAGQAQRALNAARARMEALQAELARHQRALDVLAAMAREARQAHAHGLRLKEQQAADEAWLARRRSPHPGPLPPAGEGEGRARGPARPGPVQGSTHD